MISRRKPASPQPVWTLARGHFSIAGPRSCLTGFFLRSYFATCTWPRCSSVNNTSYKTSSGDLLLGCRSALRPFCEVHACTFLRTETCHGHFSWSAGNAPNSYQRSHVYDACLNRVHDKWHVKNTLISCSILLMSCAAVNFCRQPLLACKRRLLMSDPALRTLLLPFFCAQVNTPIRSSKCIKARSNVMSVCTRHVPCIHCPYGSVISQADGSVLKASK